MPARGFLATRIFSRRIQQNLRTRAALCDALIKPHLSPTDVILDYGCGPGYFAVAAARLVRKVYACDISKGALACAAVLNRAPNIEYIVADDLGFSGVPDNSVDLVYSFAVIQHVTDDVFALILENCARKLKAGGKLLIHIVCDAPDWKSEADWKRDRSLRGRMKFRYGLNCFNRKEGGVPAFVAKHHFTNVAIRKISELVADSIDDVCRQHLITAEKESSPGL